MKLFNDLEHCIFYSEDHCKAQNYFTVKKSIL